MTEDERAEETLDGSFAETLAGEETGDATAEPERARGTQLGRYLLLHEIGHGAMGVVYAAYDPELDRKIAIKVIDSRKAGGGRASIGERSLLREAQAIAKLQHPNVIHVYDAGVAEDGVFVAMELVDGVTLGDWVQPETTVAQITAAFVQAGRGLAAAHAAGLVHRDFKPDNVLVDRQGRARVLDFGLARRPDDELAPGDAVTTAKDVALADSRESTSELQRLTRTGGIAGTPAYMSPEQFHGRGVDARSDQFAFCVALLEALDGVRPFAADDLPQLIYVVSRGQMREPPAQSRTPSWMRAILVRGLAPKPEDRWPSMDELLAALERDPARRQRGLIAGGLALAAVFGAVALRVGPAASEDDPCAGAGEAIDDSWDDAHRDAIRTALAPGDDEAVWQRVEATLDDYATQWSAMRRDACEAFEVQARQPAHVHKRRARCLDERREDLDTVVDLLDEVAPDELDSAERITTALRPIADCADVEALLAELEPPEDPAVLDAVNDARAALNRARMLKLAGRLEEATKLVDEVVDAPVTTTFAPLRAEALFWRGSLAAERNDYAGAHEAIVEAIAAAYEGRHDDYLIAGLLELPGTMKDATDRSFVEASARWARVLLQRGGGDPVRESKLESSLAAYYRRIGDLETAYTHAKRDIEIKADDDSVQNRAMALNNIGELCTQLGRLDEAREWGERALKLRTEQLGENHPHTAMSQLNLANIDLREGNYDAAQAHYEAALKIYDAVDGKDGERAGLVYGNLGVLASYRGDDEAAITYIERALEIRQSRLGADNPGLLNNIANLAELYLGATRTEDAIAFGRRAVAITDTFVATDPRRIHPRWVLASALAEGGQTEQALRVAEDAVQAAVTAVGDDHERTARMRLLAAQLHADLGQTRQATALARRALDGLGEDAADDRAAAQMILDDAGG